MRYLAIDPADWHAGKPVFSTNRPTGVPSMKQALFLLALCVSLTIRTATAQETVPFPVAWESAADSPVSMAFLLEAPAGKTGFIRVAGGHLVRPSGARFRIWGVNLTSRANFPDKQAAPQIAAHLARCGVNCVRLHFLDLFAPSGLLDSARNDSQAFDAGQLDRLDFFVAELKQRGIYTDLNLNVGRRYKPGDAVRDADLLGFGKAATYFNRRLVELQKQYARDLLTHRNPYTGNEYRNEPAVALVELVNENSLVESWFANRLLGQQTRKATGTWLDIPASYEKELTDLYQVWLREHRPPQELAELRKAAGVPGDAAIPRLRPAQFAAAPQKRFHAEAAFYMDIERRYFEEMGRFLREELAVKPLVLGTSDHNHGKSGYPLVASTSLLDVVDGHVYWQHPRYLTDPKTGRTIGFDIPNTPMVNDPLHSTPVQLSRTAVAGKPYTVSEVNHPFPHEYACEGIPILTAYAALHDWDGLFWYTLAHTPLVGDKPPRIGHFDLGPDPMKMTQVAACAPMFLRGDVRGASKTVARSYSTEQVYESLRLPWSEAPYFTPGYPAVLSLIHAARISSLAGPPTGKFEAPSADTIVSDTGELTWSGAAQKQGIVTVQTARSQAIVGFVKANAQATGNLSAQVDTPFCAITLSSLDDRPISDAARLLLTATARVANSGMQWNVKRTSLENWGAPPACIEPVTGTVTLQNLAGATGLAVQPLDAAGHPLGVPLEAKKSTKGWTVPLGQPATTWYEVRVNR
jgi:hypothetical protein